MVRRAMNTFACAAWLCCLLMIVVSWPKEASAEESQQEIGTWRCDNAKTTFYSSCPPDGLGRGVEDFWTFTGIAPENKVDVTCKFVSSEPWRGMWLFRGVETCVGRYWSDYWCGTGWCRSLKTSELPFQFRFGASLDCPTGYTAMQGQCVEIDPP